MIVLTEVILGNLAGSAVLNGHSLKTSNGFATPVPPEIKNGTSGIVTGG
jgi:hypothetical protein